MWLWPLASCTILLTFLQEVSAQRRAGGRYIAGGGVPGLAPYQLVDDYNSTNFFDKFFFFNSPDPTNGYVQYVNKSVALQNGFVNITNRNTMIIKPDTTNVYPRYSGSPGRPSVRLESLNAYFHGLFVYDTTHMPVGCGVWPAYWQGGPRWPYTGEIGQSMTSIHHEMSV